MNKQIVRQVQKSGSRFDVCVAPEVREALHVKKGDNVSFEIVPDSEIVKLSKVNPANPDLDNSQDDNRGNPVNKSGDNKETSLANRSKARRVESNKSETEIEFCLNCGSGNIEIKDNGYYCQGCDALFEFSGNGVRVVKLNPVANGIDDLESRLDQVEQDIQDIDERLNDGSDDEDGFLDWGLAPWLGFARKPVKVMSGADQGENENPDENEDENDDDLI